MSFFHIIRFFSYRSLLFFFFSFRSLFLSFLFTLFSFLFSLFSFLFFSFLFTLLSFVFFPLSFGWARCWTYLFAREQWEEGERPTSLPHSHIKTAPSGLVHPIIYLTFGVAPHLRGGYRPEVSTL